MFDELKRGMNNAFGTTVDNLVLESMVNDEIRFIMMESDEALEEACKSCAKKGCKEGADVDSTNDNIKETGSASPKKSPVGEGCRKKKCEESDEDGDNEDDDISDDEDDDLDEVQEAFIDCQFEITMEGFRPERHKKLIEKISNKVDKKLSNLKSQKQKDKLLKYLESNLEMMEMIKDEYPEEKGQGVRVVKSLISKVKSAKVAVKESFDNNDDFEDVEEALVNFEYETTMEAFTLEKHQKRLEKLTAKFEKKIANLKSEKQKERLIKRLENELVFMEEIHEDTPEEKGKGARVIKSLLVKAKRAKVPTKESFDNVMEGTEVDSSNDEIKETGAASPEDGPEDDIDRLIDEIPEDEGEEFDDTLIESLIENLPGYEF
jgi:hypothetical protein